MAAMARRAVGTSGQGDQCQPLGTADARDKGRDKVISRGELRQTIVRE